jgi:Family of unknown function (DUF6326)
VQTFDALAPTSDRSAAPGRSGSLYLMGDIRVRLSALWIVVMFNMVYADILSFLNPELLRQLMTGYAGGVRITQPLLVGSAVMVEIPILMVLLSRTTKRTVNRWANAVAVPLTGAFIIGGGSTSPHYLLLAAIELVCLALILWQVWRWPVPAGSG